MEVGYKFEIEVSDKFEIEDKEIQDVAKKAIKDNVPIIGTEAKERIIEFIKHELGTDKAIIRFKNESRTVNLN